MRKKEHAVSQDDTPLHMMDLNADTENQEQEEEQNEVSWWLTLPPPDDSQPIDIRNLAEEEDEEEEDEDGKGVSVGKAAGTGAGAKAGGEAASEMAGNASKGLLGRLFGKGAGKGLFGLLAGLKATDYLIMLAIVAGLGLLVYPTIGDLISRWETMNSIKDYDKVVDGMDEKEMDDEIERARRYNKTLWGKYYVGIGKDKKNGRNLMKEGDKKYNDILNVTKNGVMGYLIIDKIDCYSVIYHGSTNSVLAAGVGHLFRTGFPVDGPNVNGALSAHTGLVSATLFTDLDQLKVGDTFEVHILNKVYTYQIEQILIVNPSDLSNLQIEYGSNYVTLVTCYPYGVNTHRLLVKGRLQGYNYDKKDYEKYIEEAAKKRSQQVKKIAPEEEEEPLEQTGTEWDKIAKIAKYGGILAGFAFLFFLHYRVRYLQLRRARKRLELDGPYQIRREPDEKELTSHKREKISLWLVAGGLTVVCAAGVMSVSALVEEAAVGWRCESQEKQLDAYMKNQQKPQNIKTDSTVQSADQIQTSEKPKNPVVKVDGNEYIGKLSFPSLDMELPVLAECNEENLKQAPCVDSGTIEERDLIIAGHRYRRVFTNLQNLKVGDKIYLTSADNKFYTYIVKSLVEVPPHKVNLYAGCETWDLALYTCTPGGKNRQVVYADLLTQ
ncbi:MAG: class C sortase [Lachnospiraceae bacterium]